MSRIMPAMSDGRSFTNYVSSGLYNNYLENKFRTPEDSQYRQFLQKNAGDVEKVVNQLTAYYVRPPAMPTSKLNVQGDPNAKLTTAPVDYRQNILNQDYYKTLNRFNQATMSDRQILEKMDRMNMS